MPLEVISPTFGRSGSKSLKVALDTLGYKTYHACVVVTEPEWRISRLTRMCKGDKSQIDLIFEQFTAAAGHPANTLYKELLAHYPNAKVVHYTRDFDSWYLSMVLTLYPRYKALVDCPWFVKVLARRIILYEEFSWEALWGPGFFHGKFEDKEYARKRFNEHNAEVEKAVPAKQLLIFDFKDGWGPLCKFLGKPVPSIPFPYINTTADFQAETERLKTQIFVAKVIVNTGIALLAGSAWYLWSNHSNTISEFFGKARSK